MKKFTSTKKTDYEKQKIVLIGIFYLSLSLNIFISEFLLQCTIFLEQSCSVRLGHCCLATGKFPVDHPKNKYNYKYINTLVIELLLLLML